MKSIRVGDVDLETEVFIAASVRLSKTFTSQGSVVALDELLAIFAGPDWRRESERDLPGSVAAMERDASSHPSPNAGPVEAAFAAALGRRLGGSNRYDGISEDRGHLGHGPPVNRLDIERAAALHRRVGVVALVGLVSGRLLVCAGCRGRPRRW